MRIQEVLGAHNENEPVRVLIENRLSDACETGKIERLAYDILLPLPVNGLQGGRDACDALGRSLLQALRPYRRDDALELPPPQQCFTLLRCIAKGALWQLFPIHAVPQHPCLLLLLRPETP